MTAQARFRQSDLTRAIKAAKVAGERPSRALIDINGNIVLSFGGEPIPARGKGSWDDLLDDR